MSERLIIQNFGPIREANIEVRDLTILIGPQATGKSLAAQALYFMRGIEDLISPESALVSELETILSTFEWWFGNMPSVYINHLSHLEWSAEAESNSEKSELWWEQDKANVSDTLRRRVKLWADAYDSQRIGLYSGVRELADKLPHQVYIPAGRALYSFLPPYSSAALYRLNLQWTGYVWRFYETLGRAIAELWQWGQIAQELGEPAEVAHEPTFVQRKLETVVKGRIQYGPETAQLKVGEKLFRSVSMAAGQMEIWPFSAIVEAGYAYSGMTYFEEPEAHLHPGAQRIIMEVVSYLTQHGCKFVLTTHSPYILQAINNFLMMGKVLDAGQRLPIDASPETALRPSQVAAYRFSADGTIHNIVDEEAGLIDADELEQTALELGADFTLLQERLEGWV